MNALTPFDPDLPLGYDAILVQHAEAIRVLGKRVVGDIIEIGQRLTDSKARCGHGRFLPWLGREFGWSEDTAERFMQVAKVFGSNSAQCAEFELPMHGLYLLAAPSTPEAACDEVIERAEAGERMTAAQIKEVVDKAVAAEIRLKLKACEAELRAEYEGAGQTKVDKAVTKATASLQKQIDKYEAKLAKIAERDEARAERDAKNSPVRTCDSAGKKTKETKGGKEKTKKTRRSEGISLNKLMAEHCEDCDSEELKWQRSAENHLSSLLALIAYWDRQFKKKWRQYARTSELIVLADLVDKELPTLIGSIKHCAAATPTDTTEPVE